MAPCCNNTVTPRMIKSGRVSVGDRIQMEEDIMVSGEAAAEQNNAAMANASKAPASIPATALCRQPSERKRPEPKRL